MLFKKKAPQDSEEIMVMVELWSGKVVRGKCTVADFEDAKADWLKLPTNENDRVFILTIIAHPKEIKRLERV